MEGARADPGRPARWSASCSRRCSSRTSTKKPGNVTTLRIVTVDLATRATHEYLYLLDDPATTGTARQRDHRAVGDAVPGGRAGRQRREPGAFKKLFEIDLTGATDVGPRAAVPGADLRRRQGRPARRRARASTPTSARTPRPKRRQDLAAAGITPVAKKLHLDLGALVTGLRPERRLLRHDKVEGVATTDGGRTVVIGNDNDFGIDGVTNAAPPYALHPKTLPDGRSGRRRIPRGRHDEADGGDEHRDGHDRRPGGLSTSNWSTLSAVMSRGSPSRTVFDVASYFTDGNSRLTLLTGPNGLPSATLLRRPRRQVAERLDVPQHRLRSTSRRAGTA